MPGVPGAGGPVPKRSDQRRRRNRGGEPDKVDLSEGVEVGAPEPDERWHPVARQWYEALGQSGQRVFYEASDWALAYLIAESISRDLKPQVVGVKEDSGEAVMATIPLKGASLSAYLKAMTALLVTEGDRRRARIELERSAGADAIAASAVEDPEVAVLDEYRSRLTG